MLTYDEIADIFASDVRIVRIREYHDGFVSNSYRWRCTGQCTVYTRVLDECPLRRAAQIAANVIRWRSHEDVYDRRRSYGHGPAWVALSERNGRLTSA